MGKHKNTGGANGALLHADTLEKSFTRRKVVRGVSIAVNPGEIVGLLGPNGAGKTTTFGMIVGLLRPDAGRIFYGSEDITRQPMYRRARNGIAYLPQEPSVFRQLTVRQNIMAILEHQSLSRGDRDARAEELLSELNITHLADSPAYTLSGGERRRTEIARALVTNPKVFLLDEPFAGIDPIAVADLQDMMAQLKAKGIGVLITDHNVRETLGISDRAYIIIEGEVRVSGTPEEITADPTARKYYLGRALSGWMAKWNRPKHRSCNPACRTSNSGLLFPFRFLYPVHDVRGSAFHLVVNPRDILSQQPHAEEIDAAEE